MKYKTFLQNSIKIISFIMLLEVAILSPMKTMAEESLQEPLHILTTIFPIYDWTREILGDNPAEADLSFLLENGVDLHSYQPTAADLLRISECDLLIYVGGESDEWVEGALKEAVNPDMIVINLLEALGDNAREEELVEGMQEEPQVEVNPMDSPGEGTMDNPTTEEEPEYDEHVWLSLRNAEFFCGLISDALQQSDPANAALYEANTTAYLAKLEQLDQSYQETVKQGRVHTLLFGDRFPFRYLVDDYGLDYYAAFSGCSAETEASFETIIFLSDKVRELGLALVLAIEGTDHRIAQTIAQNGGLSADAVRIMDSMQSVTKTDAQNGITYDRIMEDNLEVLKEALQ